MEPRSDTKNTRQRCRQTKKVPARGGVLKGFVLLCHSGTISSTVRNNINNMMRAHDCATSKFFSATSKFD
eukprot:3223439-Rhodomonas_salina.9